MSYMANCKKVQKAEAFYCVNTPAGVNCSLGIYRGTGLPCSPTVPVPHGLSIDLTTGCIEANTGAGNNSLLLFTLNRVDMKKQTSRAPIPKVGKVSLVFESLAEVPSVVLREDGTGIEHTFINLTPHRINILDDYDETIYVFPPTGRVARVHFVDNVLAKFRGLQIMAVEKTEVVDLPVPQKNTFYIVSQIVKQHATGRNDLVSPYYAVRDFGNQVLGCRALQT